MTESNEKFGGCEPPMHVFMWDSENDEPHHYQKCLCGEAEYWECEEDVCRT